MPWRQRSMLHIVCDRLVSCDNYYSTKVGVSFLYHMNDGGFCHKCYQSLSSPILWGESLGLRGEKWPGQVHWMVFWTRLPPSIPLCSMQSKTGGRNELGANTDAEFPARIIIIMNRDSHWQSYTLLDSPLSFTVMEATPDGASVVVNTWSLYRKKRYILDTSHLEATECMKVCSIRDENNSRPLSRICSYS